MAFMSAVLTLGLVLFGFIFCLSRARVCDADRNTNGCSTPMGINAPFKRKFTPACDKHDICYGCVSVRLVRVVRVVLVCVLCVHLRTFYRAKLLHKALTELGVLAWHTVDDGFL